MSNTILRFRFGTYDQKAEGIITSVESINRGGIQTIVITMLGELTGDINPRYIEERLLEQIGSCKRNQKELNKKLKMVREQIRNESNLHG